MNASNIQRRATRPIRHGAAPHLYAVGQAVRFKGGFAPKSQSAGIYRITATLPPQAESPQYRIRNDDERHERMTTEDKLEPVSATSASDGATLVDRTFSHV
jgi:hypothetical protein